LVEKFMMIQKAASRAGSHAGRGFRYQDAAGVWLVVRCWTDELPYGEVIPEGKDDYELRGVTGTALVQAKSRRDHLGPFPVGEAADFVRDLWVRFEASSSAPSDLILLLERPVAEGPLVHHGLVDHLGLAEALRADPRWEALASRTHVWIAREPLEDAVAAISHAAPSGPLAAQVHYGELLHRIGALADANGLAKDGCFGGLSVSDVEASIRRLEPLLNLAGMEVALRDGYCDVVDFLTPLNDPAFYQGVDTQPGHIAAGLVAERPESRRPVLEALEARRAALIVGPSGVGKSALMWEAARAARHTVRWFQVRRGNSTDAHLFIRLAHALRATPAAPIGFVVDDVGRGLSDLWDGLIRESAAGSGILILGSIREEDLLPLSSRSRAREIRPAVGEAVAERIWRRLSERHMTSWAGWREPWMRSNGLLLEYTHILTRGDRLETVLAEQIDRRLREARDTELAVLRITAAAGAAGALIDPERLAGVLNITADDLSRALRRLIAEHLVAESAAGFLGGLHQLRSTTVFDLCNAHPPPTRSKTIASAVHAATGASLGALATYVIVHHPGETASLVQALAERLEQDGDSAAAAGALSGLGQAHIETTLRRWIPEALSLGLEQTQVTLAVMFAVAGMDLSSMPFPDRLREAVRALRIHSASDPRLQLLSALSAEAIRAFIVRSDAPRLRALLGALVGVATPKSIQSALATVRPDFDAIDLAGAADLLGAARLIDTQTAVIWADGAVRDRLLARVPVETPWSSAVEVEATSEGRLLRSSIRHVAPSVQTDVHENVVQLCDLLLGLDPTADVAAVSAVVADGLMSGLPDHPLAEKHIARANMPNSALPQWNRRWIDAAARLMGAESYTGYLQRAGGLLGQLVPALEGAIDALLRGKQPPPQALQILGNVHMASRALTAPRDGPPTGSAADTHVTPLQNLLFSCSADLVRRFSELPDGSGAFVMWVSDLLKNVREARNEPWALLNGPPEELFQRLEGLFGALRLLSAEAGARDAQPIMLWKSVTRDTARGNALRRARNAVEHSLRTQSANYLNRVEADLAKAGIELELHARPDWDIPLPWPTLELLAITQLDSPADWLPWTAEQAPRLRAAVGDGRRIWVAPRIGGLLVSRLTIGGVFTLFPSPYAVDEWMDSLRLRRLDDALTRAAQGALDLIIELDGLRCFDLGTDCRPAVERSVREDDERQLSEALLAFEALAEGGPVQGMLRELAETVAAQRIALAEGAAALTHGRLTLGGKALIGLSTALLSADLAAAQ